jgi:hypothetical protein
VVLATVTAGLAFGTTPAAAGSRSGGASRPSTRVGNRQLWRSAERRVAQLTRHLLAAVSSPEPPSPAPAPAAPEEARRAREQEVFQELLDAALEYGHGMGEPAGSDPERRQAEDANLTEAIGRLQGLIDDHPGGLHPIRRPAVEAVEAAERIALITAASGPERADDRELVEAELRLERARLRVARRMLLDQLQSGQLATGADRPAVEALLAAGRKADQAAGDQAKQPTDEIRVETRRWVAGIELEAAWQRLLEETLDQVAVNGRSAAEIAGDRARVLVEVLSELLDRPDLPDSLRARVEEELAAARHDLAGAPEQPEQGGGTGGEPGQATEETEETEEPTRQRAVGATPEAPAVTPQPPEHPPAPADTEQPARTGSSSAVARAGDTSTTPAAEPTAAWPPAAPGLPEPVRVPGATAAPGAEQTPPQRPTPGRSLTGAGPATTSRGSAAPLSAGPLWSGQATTWTPEQRDLLPLEPSPSWLDVPGVDVPAVVTPPVLVPRIPGAPTGWPGWARPGTGHGEPDWSPGFDGGFGAPGGPFGDLRGPFVDQPSGDPLDRLDCAACMLGG